MWLKLVISFSFACQAFSQYFQRSFYEPNNWERFQIAQPNIQSMPGQVMSSLSFPMSNLQMRNPFNRQYVTTTSNNQRRRYRMSSDNSGNRIWYYNNNGQSYTFTVPVGVPMDRNNMIRWIENNSNMFNRITIPYTENDDDINSNTVVNQPLLSSQPVRSPPPQTRAPSPSTSNSRTSSPWDGNRSRCVKGSGKSHKASNKVMGGKEVSIEDNPWQVGFILSRDKLNCGGSLITMRHVVSAAHCFVRAGRALSQYEITSTMSVIAGTSNGASNEYHKIAHTFVHSKYDDNRNDIALVFLETKFDSSDSIASICLPPKGIGHEPGTECRATGWGGYEDGVLSKHLRATDLEISDAKECTKVGGWLLTQGQICAGGHNKDACNGDSGGPLVCEIAGDEYLYGLTSYGAVCKRDQGHLRGVYTSLSAYRDWIENKMELTKKQQIIDDVSDDVDIV